MIKLDQVKHLKVTEYNLIKNQFDLFKQKDYESIILCGIEAHACVLSTCLDFLAANKEVHVVTDTVSSRSLVDR